MIGAFFNPILAGATAASMLVDFDASTQSTEPGIGITFSNLSTPTPDFNFWTFGDGSFSTASNPNKSYSAVGTYSVILRAVDAVSGGIEEKIDYISISTLQDNDADAFLTAAGITDTTISSAITVFVIGLKDDGLWTKMKAIYPFVGGTATTHKFNLKDPQDTNAAFRLSFSGTITHNSNGITGNGTNGFADTFLQPSSVLTNNSTHLSVFSRTSTASGSVEIGSGIGIATGSDPRFLITVRWTNDGCDTDQYNFGNGRATFSNTNATGFYIGTRQSSSSLKLFKNGVQEASNTNSSNYGSVTDVTTTITILAFNDGAGGGLRRFFSNKNISFASIGDGLSDTEASDFNTRVQALQTALSR